VVKLIDLGCARPACTNATTSREYESDYYTPPEVLERANNKTTPATPQYRERGRMAGDVFSLGWVLAELCAGRLARDVVPLAEADWPNLARDLVIQSLAPVWTDRPRIDEVAQSLLNVADQVSAVA
jgi:serine/threonine protein kinase